MIIMLSASAIVLAGLQAGINAPRSAFTTCLKATSAKASTEKVPAEGYEAYLRTACGSQIDAFKDASVKFDVKNGVSRKDATATADEMIGEWVGDSVESYRFQLEIQPKAQAKAAPAQPSQPVPASAPQQ